MGGDVHLSGLLELALHHRNAEEVSSGDHAEEEGVGQSGKDLVPEGWDLYLLLSWGRGGNWMPDVAL